MPYLVIKAKNDLEWVDPEFVPSHYILELNKASLDLLTKYTQMVNNINSADLVNVKFYFGFGLWTKSHDWMLEKFDEDISYHSVLSKNSDFPPTEDLELNILDSFMVEIDPNDMIRFICFGKYSGDMFYTTSVSLQKLDMQYRIGDAV